MNGEAGNVRLHSMQNCDLLQAALNQNEVLPIRLVTPDFGHLAPDEAARLAPAHRLPYYLFLFVWQGSAEVNIDMESTQVGARELSFYLPHQVRSLATQMHGQVYYKLGLPEDLLARMPRRYPFLLNPLARHKVRFDESAAGRMLALFELLKSLLGDSNAEPELILAHLNSLLTEINVAYFSAAEPGASALPPKYLQFLAFVEGNLTEHPSVQRVADELALSTDALYQLIKRQTGLPPKDFMTRRLMLEARRRLYFESGLSVKELAFGLGFSDPNYFSRLFKKTTGQTVGAFLKDLS